jgi:hypothetical protein
MVDYVNNENVAKLYYRDKAKGLTNHAKNLPRIARYTSFAMK